MPVARGRVGLALLVVVVLGAAACAFAATWVADGTEAAFYNPVAVLALLTVGVQWRLARDRDLFSPLGLATIFFQTTFVFGAVYFHRTATDPLSGRFPSELLPQAVWMAVAAYASLAAGYFLNPLRVVALPARRLNSVLSRPPTTEALVILSVLGWLGRLLLLATGRYLHGQEDSLGNGATIWILTLSKLPLLVLAVVWITYLRQRATGATGAKAVVVALAALEFAWAVPSGSRANVLSVAAMLVVTYYYVRGRFPNPATLAVAAFLAVFVVFPVLAEYRKIDSSSAGTGSRLVTTAVSTFQQPVGALLENGFNATFGRFSASTSVAAAIGGGPQSFPLPRGETYKALPAQFIPSALWPGKPNLSNYGVIFGQSFGITSSRNFRTSIASTQFIEAWLSYGYTGLVVLTALLGAAFRWVGTALGGRRTNVSVLAVYGWLAWTFINSQESILASAGVAVAKSLIVGIVLLAALNLVGFLPGRRATSAREPR